MCHNHRMKLPLLIIKDDHVDGAGHHLLYRVLLPHLEPVTSTIDLISTQLNALLILKEVRFVFGSPTYVLGVIVVVKGGSQVEPYAAIDILFQE